MVCPCSSGKNFEDCCQPLLFGLKHATSAQELMRSRYSAYTTSNGKYLVDTTAKENRFEGDAALIVDHAKSITWIKLEILHADEKEVEFRAYYQNNEDKRYHVHHEISTFIFENDKVYYHSGKLLEDKIARNEPCPCDSGKKYKKCCL